MTNSETTEQNNPPLPEGWSWTTLGELTLSSSYGTSARCEYENDGPIVLRIPNVRSGEISLEDIKHAPKTFLLDPGDYVAPGDFIVIRTNGSQSIIGQGAAVMTALSKPVYFASYLIRFRLVADPVIHRWLNHFWQSSGVRDWMKANAASSAGQFNISQTSLSRVPIPVAPKLVRERIVAKLDELLSDIEAGEQSLQRAALLVKRYRQSVLKAAVTGELTKDWRAKNLARLKKEKKTGEDLLAAILVKRRAAWEAAELATMIAKGKAPKDDKWKKKYVEPAAPKLDDLPELPEGWVWGTLGQLISWIEAGKNFRCAERPPVGREVGVVKVSAVTWGVFNEQESKTITDERLVNLKLKIAPGDLLFSRANTLPLVGASVIVANCTRTLLLSDKILRLHMVDELKRWVDIVLKSPVGRQQIEALATGNQESMRNITQDNIYRIAIPIPPSSELDEAGRSFDEEWSKSEHAHSVIAAERKRSQSLQQAILSSAFSGELVDRDPIDEPASALLERIRAERNAPKPPPPKAQAETKKPGTRGGRRKKAAESRDAQGKLL